MLLAQRYRTTSLLTAFLLGCSAIFLAMPSATAYTFNGCKWASANITYNNTTSGVNRTAFANATSEWSSKTDANLSSNTGSSNFFLVASNQGASGFGGFTTTECPGGRTFRVNSSLNTYYSNSYSAGQRQAMATHEMGHGLGLDHVSTTSAIMYRAPLSSTSIFPKTDDIRGVNALY